MEPPPPPHALDRLTPPPTPLLNPQALDQLLTHTPERAAALLRLLDGGTYITQVQAHAALVGVPLTCILTEWSELLRLAVPPLPLWERGLGSEGIPPRRTPPRPRMPWRPSINPNVPKRAPRTPHGPGDGRRKRWPRYIRMRDLRSRARV